MYHVYYSKKIKDKNKEKLLTIYAPYICCGVIYAPYIFCTCIVGKKKINKTKQKKNTSRRERDAQRERERERESERKGEGY
jgi:hypothetical protein